MCDSINRVCLSLKTTLFVVYYYFCGGNEVEIAHDNIVKQKVKNTPCLSCGLVFVSAFVLSVFVYVFVLYEVEIKHNLSNKKSKTHHMSLLWLGLCIGICTSRFCHVFAFCTKLKSYIITCQKTKIKTHHISLRRYFTRCRKISCMQR
jgi:hypothetical protein